MKRVTRTSHKTATAVINPFEINDSIDLVAAVVKAPMRRKKKTLIIDKSSAIVDLRYSTDDESPLLEVTGQVTADPHSENSTKEEVLFLYMHIPFRICDN